jgi:replication initiation and membrane attachment protein
LKLLNLLQLTDHHRFIVVREFGLSSLDRRILTTLYQPLIGSSSIALYMTMCSQLPAEMVGSSKPGSLSMLFLACGMQPNENGRKQLMDDTSQLEAVGLLRTSRITDEHDVIIYEFDLLAPVLPHILFSSHYLWLMFQERMGSAAAEQLRQSFITEKTKYKIIHREVISVSFQEQFRLIHPMPATTTPVRLNSADAFNHGGFMPNELLRRFPKSSVNRKFLENMLSDNGLVTQLNYWAGKYELTLKETVSLLDEGDMFLSNGDFHVERFQTRAVEIRRQISRREEDQSPRERKREVQAISSDNNKMPLDERESDEKYWLEVPETFLNDCNARQYNSLLVNASYDQLLKIHFRPASVPLVVREAFLKMHLDYHLPDEVINVLIHYVRKNALDWSPKYLDAIAANVVGKHIRTFEQAVAHFRKAEQVRNGTQDSAKVQRGMNRTTERKEQSKFMKPQVASPQRQSKKAASEEDIRRILEKAKRLQDT